MTFEGFDVQWAVLAPLIALFVTAAFGVLFALIQTDSRATALVSLIGIATAAVFNLNLFMDAQAGTVSSAFGLRYLGDTAALGFNFVILLGTALAVLVSYDYVRRTHLEQPEYYPLMLLSATGAMVMAGAGDLITLVLGLEILSLAVYVLSAWRQGARESEEAGMKYFLLGAFASAFLIYGAALVFGATGSFTYVGIVAAITAEGYGSSLLASLGGFFVLGGLAFKASLAPFHQWAPDVYTGAPTSVTTYMSVVVKTAAFAALLRLAVGFFPNLMPGFVTTFAVLVGLTMIVGNFAALLQSGVKRMLAYSAVAHAGYLGLAVLAAGTVGMSAAGWYLLAYTLMTAGAFAVLTLLSDASDRGDDLDRFAGLGRTRPALAFAFAIFLLSLTGIPPLAGFTGKVLVFQAAIVAGYAPLAVIGILTSVVAAVYYFRVIAYMYFRESEYEPLAISSRVTSWTVGFAAAATVLLGILPGWWYGLLGAGREVLARL
jgi:NADH-quinone oxidoreductase subunit N